MKETYYLSPQLELLLIPRSVSNSVTSLRVLAANIGYSATLLSSAAFDYRKKEIVRHGQDLDLPLLMNVKVRVFELIECSFLRSISKIIS